MLKHSTSNHSECQNQKLAFALRLSLPLPLSISVSFPSPLLVAHWEKAWKGNTERKRTIEGRIIQAEIYKDGIIIYHFYYCAT